MMDEYDCAGCQYWDGDDGICHHWSRMGRETKDGCEYWDGGQDDG